MTEAHVARFCQPMTPRTCRYLIVSDAGWGCAKLSSLAGVIDERVRRGTFRAVGDNCAGLPPPAPAHQAA